MGKVIFRYGAMGASKTANLIMMRYNYLEKGKTPILLKPKMENRDGLTVIKSRIGLFAECLYAEDFAINPSNCDVIIVDEAQFLNSDTIESLIKIADLQDIPIVFYGLKTDFKSRLFEGSKRIIELADKIEEIPTICWCGKKARFNAKVINGKVIKTGDSIDIGGNEKYVSLCRKHYLNEQLCETLSVK